MIRNEDPPSYSEAMKEGSVIVNENPEILLQPNVTCNDSSRPGPKSYGSISESNTINDPAQIIIVGGCPTCRTGILEPDYPCLGWFCGIIFFPIGILLCLMMKQRRCTNCGAIFD